MSSAGWGKAIESWIWAMFVILGGFAVLVGISSLATAHLGPLGSGLCAAVVVYLGAVVLTRSVTSTGGIRPWTMLGAGLAAAAGSYCFQQVGGMAGSLAGALVTTVLAGVLMYVLPLFFSGR